jgi:hypothetical protein
LLTQGLKRSLQRELNSFYQKLQKKDFLSQYVTKGAFSRARSGLAPEAFIELNQTGTANFYRNAPWLRWQGFRLLACDGSTAVLPAHPSVEKEFGITGFGPHADSKRSVARISLLYDVLNFITLDGQIASYDTSERTLLRGHLPCINPQEDLLVLDRGYPGYGLLFELQSLGIHYCIRLRDDWWMEVRKMLDEGVQEKEVTFHLPKTELELRDKYPQFKTAINCRLVSVTLPDGSRQTLCTSLSADRLPAAQVAELYRFRWNIEEGYKLYKSRMNLEAFSGKTALAVKQDFYAGIFMMTMAAVMGFPVAQEVKKIDPADTRKHPRQINRVNALAMIRETALDLLAGKVVEPLLDAFDHVLRKTTEIIRPSRKVPRKKLKNKPPSMNYKIL